VPSLPIETEDSASTPTAEIAEHPVGSAADELHTLSASHLSQHNLNTSKDKPLEWIVVRIEVTDTGYGIRRQDMLQSKLFCKLSSLTLA
jgi:osomolarity two-component system sensor histidine kinase SLN1